MWKNYISTISSEYYFKDPVSDADLTLIKRKLNVELPEDLLQLYNETNGVYDEFHCPLIWSIDQIVADNLNYRSEEYKDMYMPVDHLLFFSDAGNGDLFGYAIRNEVIQTNRIYVWNHEDDSRTFIAPSLKYFIKGWITDEISV
ncbi:SMI1/KNR4 family protein [Paenibacillus sp. WQ 127069]|uniref:SMI1/KNR4 family protein n=1 Tax=Paenibacillus baimaensis TaxID=2982185 RepID=A0ABT2UFU2_9BACL|nr:SMI1/KNR4 family protein [Paenibacillus sp. WQ 127069]MCU6793503.1 SMI1/KNR4 family protein [Paenibacillus sp. WQ 127069]